MLTKGDYMIIEIISISRPLSTLKDGQHNQEDVYKCVLEKDKNHLVVYLLGNVDFGKRSIISIKEDKDNVLLYPDDYILKSKEILKINKKLIDNLLQKKS